MNWMKAMRYAGQLLSAMPLVAVYLADKDESKLAVGLYDAIYPIISENLKGAGKVNSAKMREGIDKIVDSIEPLV